MDDINQNLTLHQPATYQIKVPGLLDKGWADWAGGMAITVETRDNEPRATTLTGIVADQAALQSLLRRLYSLGLPLMSVRWID